MIKWTKGEDEGGKYIIHMGAKIYYEEIFTDETGHVLATDDAKVVVATLSSDHTIEVVQ